MPAKYYISPIIGNGSEDNPFRAKISDYPGVSCSSIIPSKPDGTPRFTWTLVYVSGLDFSALDADLEIKDVFEKFASGVSFGEIQVFLKSKTVGDLAVTKRSAVQTYLTALGVDLTGVTLSTQLWDVVKRVKNHLDPNGQLDDLRVG